MPELAHINAPERVQWIYSSANNDELAARYDLWAQEYDDDLANTFAWLAPRIAAEVLAEHVPAGAKILDAGGRHRTRRPGTPTPRLHRHLRYGYLPGYAGPGPRQGLLQRLPPDDPRPAPGL